MNKKNITPNLANPINRVPTGQSPELPSALAELSESALHSSHVLPSFGLPPWMGVLSPDKCSYDGDDAE